MEKVTGSCIYIPSNVKHSYKGNESTCFSILIDPLCELSHYLKKFNACISLPDPVKMQDKFNIAMKEPSSDAFQIKKYILLCKWKASYLQMLISKDVTSSAMNSGFCAPSHFSKVNTELTGITAKHMNSHRTLIKNEQEN